MNRKTRKSVFESNGAHMEPAQQARESEQRSHWEVVFVPIDSAETLSQYLRSMTKPTSWRPGVEILSEAIKMLPFTRWPEAHSSP